MIYISSALHILLSLYPKTRLIIETVLSGDYYCPSRRISNNFQKKIKNAVSRKNFLINRNNFVEIKIINTKNLNMAINLQKGQRIDVGFTCITIGLGWDPNEGTGSDFDLDASAFMLNKTKRIPSEPYFVFYGNTNSPDDSLHHTGDDPTGGNSANGDDESIKVDLSKVSGSIEEILFVVTIHDAINRRQNYGQVRNSYIRIVDDHTGKEVAKYELDEDFSVETAVEFGRLYKRNGCWKFEASGIGYKEDLAFFLSKYYQGQIIK